jgi:nucleoside-diphosphate-sugar epimerase
MSRMETVRIVVIGASGTIGKAVVKSFPERHEVLQVRHSKGDYRVDIASKESVKKLFEMHW